MVETITLDQFEEAMQSINSGVQNLGIEQGEYTFFIPIDARTGIKVRSSINHSQVSAGCGDDSIRAWLAYSTGEPMGAKVDRLTKRTRGWEGRLSKKIDLLIDWRQLAGDCPVCGEPCRIFKVKKNGKNKGRPFAKCRKHNQQTWKWLDGEGKGGSNNKVKTLPEMAYPRDTKTATARPDNPMRETPSISTSQNDSETYESNGGQRDVLPQVLDFLSGEDAELALPQDEPEEAPQAITFKREPNPAQREAIEAPINSAVRVSAPPGSGKTYVIEQRYRFLLANGIDPKNIVCCTYSKTMADEMLGRIAKESPEIRGTKAEQQICTIHALCYRLLRAEDDRREVYDPGKNFRHRGLDSPKRILQEIAEKLWPFAEERPGWKELAHWVAQPKCHGLTNDQDLSFYEERLGGYNGRKLHQTRKQYDDKMKRQNLIDFADMLLDTEVKLERDRTFREKWQQYFQYVVLDEGQDVTGQAMRIFSVLAAPQNNFFIVGDDAQLLFRFAGATPETNLHEGFEERYPDGKLVNLTVNYRSTQTIVDTQRELITYNYTEAGGPYDQKYMKAIETRPDASKGDPITWNEYDDAFEEAVALAEGVKTQLLYDCDPGQIFVGARTKAQLGYLEGPLTRAKIPFINITGGSFWTMKHVADVIAYLKLAHDNSDNEAFRRVYNIASQWMKFPWKRSPRHGEYCHHRFLGRAFLSACNEDYRNVWNAAGRYRKFEPGVKNLVSFVNELKTYLEAEEPAEAVEFVIENCYEKWLQADEGNIHSDEAENGKMEDLQTVKEIAATFTSIAGFLAYVAEMVKAAQAAKDKDWSNYVVLSTVHRLKGLERDVVYGVGLSEGTSNGLLPHTFSKVPPPQNGVLPSGGMSPMEDERCIAFVLVSRARNEVHLSGVRKYRNKEMWASRFVGEMGLTNSRVGIPSQRLNAPGATGPATIDVTADSQLEPSTNPQDAPCPYYGKEVPEWRRCDGCTKARECFIEYKKSVS